MPLLTAPRLASFDATSHPDQLRLRAALAHAAEVLRPTLDAITGDIALRLDVGLADHVPLLAQHDLDNYAHPLAAHVAKVHGPLVSVWVTKRHAAQSFVRAEAAAPATPPSTMRVLTTTASATTEEYKRQIHRQVAAEPMLPAGPVAMELAFVVGPRRNWMNLWKQTIDALDPLLGRTRPQRDWHPLDGRITSLGLHRAVDPHIGNNVVIGISAAASPRES